MTSRFSTPNFTILRPGCPSYCYCIHKIMLNEYIQGTLPTHPYLSRCTLYTSVSPQLLYRKDLERIIMGKHKQAACEICFKHMRSDNLKRHYQNKHILSFFTSSSTKQTTEKCVRPCIQSRKKFKDGEAPKTMLLSETLSST